MLLELRFSVFTLGLGSGTFVAALYGMNLKNFLEESDLGFTGISLWCTVFGTIVCIWGLNRLRRVQRVSMWGEPKPKRSWRDWGFVGGPTSREREIIAQDRADRERVALVIAKEKKLAAIRKEAKDTEGTVV